MTRLTDTFSALGDETRFAIVERLMRDGEQSAGALQDVADISAPAISRHLKVLRNAGVIRQRVDRQSRMYSVAPESVQAINDWVAYYRKFWQASLERLQEALENEEENDG